MECYCYLRNTQDLLSDGNGRTSPFFCQRPVATASIWPKSLAKYVPWTCVARGRNLERRQCGRRHRGIGPGGRIWTPRQKAQCNRSTYADEKWHFIFPITDETVKTPWRRSTSETIHLNPEASRTRRGTRNSSRRIRRTLFSIAATSGLNTGDFIYRVEHRVKLYMPKEESFPILLKYIDVTRNTHTSSDVLLEKHIDDYWNVDGDRELSDAWTGFMRCILLNERPPDGYTWSGWGD